MKNLLIILLFLFSQALNAQKNDTSSFLRHTLKPFIEINPFIRFDSYPGFIYAINPTNSYKIDRITGTNWGINAMYKFPIKRKTYLKAGIGYYKYAFGNIEGSSNWGETDARIINYPSNIQIIYTSNKYSYNCISLIVGAEQWFKINKTLFLYGTANLNDFYTISQYYRITADYPTGPPNHRYTTHQQRNFGLSANVSLGLLKTYHKIAIGPAIIIPVYDTWHKDQVFPDATTVKGVENPSSQRSKLLHGIGLGISCNYSLNPKNK